jgi:hypothetical protein
MLEGKPKLAVKSSAITISLRHTLKTEYADFITNFTILLTRPWQFQIHHHGAYQKYSK